MDDKNIPAILKQIRSALQLSQEDVAAKLGVAFSTLNCWKNGKIAPRGKAKEAISKLVEESGLSEPSSHRTADRWRRASRDDLLTTKSMEQMLWSAACSIRGEKDAPKFMVAVQPGGFSSLEPVYLLRLVAMDQRPLKCGACKTRHWPLSTSATRSWTASLK